MLALSEFAESGRKTPLSPMRTALDRGDQSRPHSRASSCLQCSLISGVVPPSRQHLSCEVRITETAEIALERAVSSIFNLFQRPRAFRWRHRRAVVPSRPFSQAAFFL